MFNSNKKYKLTKEFVTYSGRVLSRIQALKDFSNVKKGDLGGYVETESNLSQDGDCWLYDFSKAYYLAKVVDNAKLRNMANASGNAIVGGNCQLHNDSAVYGHTNTYGNVKLFGSSKIYGMAVVSGSTQLYDNAEICGNAYVWENVTLDNSASISNKTYLAGNIHVSYPSQYLYFDGVGTNWDSISFIQDTDTRIVHVYSRGNESGVTIPAVLSEINDSGISEEIKEEFIRLVEFARYHFSLTNKKHQIE